MDLKKLLLIFVISLTYLGSVNAIELNDDVYSFWTFNNTVLDSLGINNGTISGNTGYVDGKIGNATDYDGTDDLVTLPLNAKTFTNGISFIGWFKAPDVTPASLRNAFVFYDGTGGHDWTYLNLDTSGNIIAGFWIDGNNYAMTNTTAEAGISDNTWFHYALRHNTSSNVVEFYINNVLIQSKATAGVLTFNTAGVRQFGSDDSDTRDWLGQIDAVGIWNRTLTNSELTSLYNGGVGLEYPFIISTNNIVIYNLSTNENSTYPVIDDILNFTFNVNSTDGNNITNCTLQTNETGIFTDKTNITINDLNVSVTINYTINSNMNNNITWRLQCFNTLGKVNISETSTFEVKDFTNTTIVLNPSNGFNESNTSVITKAIENLTLNITFFDYNLFQTLVNITCDDAGNIYTDEVLDHNTSTYNLIDTVDLSSYSLQKCYANIQASDDHTDEFIPNYKVSSINNGILFKTDANVIEILSDNDYEKHISKKNVDRYNFEFKYNNKKLMREYIVKANNKIYYIADSDYIGHFVVWNDKLKKGNWIDFEEIDHNYKHYNVKKINDYEYKVTIFINVPQYIQMEPRKKGAFGIFGDDMNQSELENYYYGIDDIKFNSVGGTNIVNNTYEFYIGGAINITGINIYDNGPITNYTINLTTNVGLLNITKNILITNVSQLITGFPNGSYNLFVDSNEFFNKSYNVTVNEPIEYINYSSYQAILNFKIKNIATGLFLDTFNVSLYNNMTGLTTNYNTTTETLTAFVNTSYYSYNVTKLLYDIFAGAVNITLYENLTIINNVSFIAQVNLFDEKTGDAFNFTSPDLIQFQVFCPDETVITTVNSSNFTLPISCDFDKFRFVLFYGTTNYYRTLILTPTQAANFSVYLIDLANTAAIFNSFFVDDLLDEYDNVRLFFTKIIGNETVLITSDFVDVENKVGVYLIENGEYDIQVISDNQPTRNEGAYLASTAGDKSIRLYDINLDTNPQNAINTMSFSSGTQNVSGDVYAVTTFNDTSGIASDLIWELRYPSPNGTLLYTVSSTSSSIEFTYNITGDLSLGAIYSILTIDHPDIDSFDYVKLIHENNAVDLPIKDYVDQTLLNWIFTLLIGMIALYASIKTANYAAMGIVAIASIFVMFGWFTIGVSALALAGLIALISLIKTGDSDGKLNI